MQMAVQWVSRSNPGGGAGGRSISAGLLRISVVVGQFV